MPTYSKPLSGLSLLGALVAVLLTFAPGPVRADVAALDQAMQEMSIGSADAPLTMYEYSSLTCPHCANFHTETLPDIKNAYVETGKVRIVFKDFPLDNLALAALMIVRCSGPERNVDFFDMLYGTQADWSRSDNPRAALIALARFYGMNADDVNACLTDQALADAILAERTRAVDLHNIQSTPTFILDGKTINGALSFDDFKDAIDKALANKGAN